LDYQVRAKEEEEQKVRPMLCCCRCRMFVLSGKDTAQLAREVTMALTIPTIGIAPDHIATGSAGYARPVWGSTRNSSEILRQYADMRGL